MCVCVCVDGEGRVMDSVTMGILTRWEGRRASIRHLVCVSVSGGVCLFTNHHSGFNEARAQRGDVSGAECVCVCRCKKKCVSIHARSWYFYDRTFT